MLRTREVCMRQSLMNRCRSDQSRRKEKAKLYLDEIIESDAVTLEISRDSFSILRE